MLFRCNEVLLSEDFIEDENGLEIFRCQRLGEKRPLYKKEFLELSFLFTGNEEGRKQGGLCTLMVTKKLCRQSEVCSCVLESISCYKIN